MMDPSFLRDRWFNLLEDSGASPSQKAIIRSILIQSPIFLGNVEEKADRVPDDC